MYKLFVFIRSDLESMTPGKAAAQVAHAASQVAYRAKKSTDHDFIDEYDLWENSALPAGVSASGSEYAGFGTTIVLDGGGLEDLDRRIDPELEKLGLPSPDPEFFSLGVLASGIVKDPSYPIRDGLVTHGIDIRTCFWIFDDPDSNKELRAFLDGFRLYGGYNPNRNVP